MRLARRALAMALAMLTLCAAASAQTLEEEHDQRNQANAVVATSLLRSCASPTPEGERSAAERAAKRQTRSEVLSVIAPTITDGSTFEPNLRYMPFDGQKLSLSGNAFEGVGLESGGAL